MMTLDAFRATARDMTNAAGEVTARTYLEVLFIERWIDGRAGIAPPGGVPTWLLTTDGPEQETGALEVLEIKLYAWAVVNGYCDEDATTTEAAAAPIYTNAQALAAITAQDVVDHSQRIGWDNEGAAAALGMMLADLMVFASVYALDFDAELASARDVVGDAYNPADIEPLADTTLPAPTAR